MFYFFQYFFYFLILITVYVLPTDWEGKGVKFGELVVVVVRRHRAEPPGGLYSAYCRAEKVMWRPVAPKV